MLGTRLLSSSDSWGRAQSRPLGQAFSDIAGRAEHCLVLVAPYIQRGALEAMTNTVRARQVVILTTWHIRDVESGVTDLGVYELCKSRGWTLWAHPRLHAKVLIRDWQEALVGSANFTASGLGFREGANEELVVHLRDLPGGLNEWLSRLIADASRIDEDYYRHVKEATVRNQVPFGVSAPHGVHVAIPDMPKDLLDSIPRSLTPSVLIDAHQALLGSTPERLDPIERHNTLGDLFRLGIANSQCAVTRSELRKHFFGLPGLLPLQEFLREGRFFGQVKDWLRRNCRPSVPLPDWELKLCVRRLFDWMVELGDGRYQILRPHHSECLCPSGMPLNRGPRLRRRHRRRALRRQGKYPEQLVQSGFTKGASSQYAVSTDL